MYDKHGIVLRIETTANDVSFFKHHRKVEHRQGPPTREVAPVKKTIYSLIDLREIWLGCNRRYLAHLSALDDFSAGVRSLARLTKSRQVRGRTVRGLNFFAPDERALLHAIQDPKGTIARIPPWRPAVHALDILADAAVATTAQIARYRGRQARQGNLPLLPDQGRPWCCRRGGAADTDGHRSVCDLMGFLLRSDSTQNAPRVRP
jgi:hypothetical protein